MRRKIAKVAAGLGLVACVGVLGACNGDGGDGRSHDWRSHDEGIRPAQGGTYSGEGRGVDYLKRTPNTGRQDARPTSEGGVREATPK